MSKLIFYRIDGAHAGRTTEKRPNYRALFRDGRLKLAADFAFWQTALSNSPSRTQR